MSKKAHQGILVWERFLTCWYHIGLTEDYNWHSSAAERMNVRSLNL